MKLQHELRIQQANELYRYLDYSPDWSSSSGSSGSDGKEKEEEEVLRHFFHELWRASTNSASTTATLKEKTNIVAYDTDALLTTTATPSLAMTNEND
eukprot:2738191-Ditylum_brightwellii.AAC.1